MNVKKSRRYTDSIQVLNVPTDAKIILIVQEVSQIESWSRHAPGWEST